jgi:hypothetical protein
MILKATEAQTDVSIPREVDIDVGLSIAEKDKALSAGCLRVVGG